MVDSVLEVQNIKLPDSGVTTGANVFTSTGNVPTIANGVTLTDNYYLQGRVSTNYTSSLPVNINFDETTQPYWIFTSDSDWSVSGTGSNFSKGTTNSDLKIHRAGVYLLNFSVTGYENTPTVEAELDVQIRGTGSGSTTVLCRAADQIAAADSGTNFGNALVSLVYKFNADDQINFYISSQTGNSANVYNQTHFNMCLIRPL